MNLNFSISEHRLQGTTLLISQYYENYIINFATIKVWRDNLTRFLSFAPGSSTNGPLTAK